MRNIWKINNFFVCSEATRYFSKFGIKLQCDRVISVDQQLIISVDLDRIYKAFCISNLRKFVLPTLFNNSYAFQIEKIPKVQNYGIGT